MPAPRLLACLLALALGLLGAGAAASPAAAAPRVTVIGDSVQESFAIWPQAVRHLRRGLSVRLEARVCRRLASPGCLGGSPESAVDLADALGPRLGEVVVLHIGYNDFAGAYDTDAIMAALRRAGVKAVVWVTLREVQPQFPAMNALIRRATREANRRAGGPIVRIADWDAHSDGHPGWFAEDDVHLGPAGSLNLAGLIRDRVLDVLAEVGIPVAGRPVVVRPDVFRLGRRVDVIAGDRDRLWVAGAGRLGARDASTGAAVPGDALLGGTEDLLSDGRQAWLADAGGRAIELLASAPRRPRVPRLAPVGPRPLLARAGRWLWTVAPCRRPPRVGCAVGRPLIGIRPDDRRRRGRPLGPVSARAIAADTASLWVLVAGAGGRAALQHRDPRTGALRSSTPLPRQAAGGRVVAGRRGAWVLTSNGQLLAVARGGAVRHVRGRLRAVAATGDQLWAVAMGAETIRRLDPDTGRDRLRVAAGRPLSRQIAFTGGHVWFLSASGTEAVRLPRG